MCFYVNINIKPIDVNQHFDKLKPDLSSYLSPNNNFISAFEKPLLPLLIFDNSYKFQNYVWGLIPEWTENIENFNFNTLNAREETLLTKPSFKDYINSQRGILPINGFYEWQHNGKNRLKFHISLKDNPILNIGVVYHQFTNQNNDLISSFSIITQKANKFMEKIHNTKKRMPLIIPRGQEEIWLSKDLNFIDSKVKILSIEDNELIANPIDQQLLTPQINLF